MIKYLKIEIAPVVWAGTSDRQLNIKIQTDQNPYCVEKREICCANDLTSFFDRIFECAKQEILQALKGE